MKYIQHKDKLNKIKLDKDNFYVVIDFDRTITRANSISGWRVLYYSDLLGETFKQKYMKIHSETELSESESNETKQNAFEERFMAYMDLLRECHFNEEILKKAVEKTDLALRDGAQDFFKEMYENHIPVIIISCSIKNVVEEYLKQNHIDYDNIYIYANYFDMNGKKENDVTNVTPYNKNKIEFSKKLKEVIKHKKYIVLLGDITDDANMVTKEKLKDTVTIGFLEKNIEANLEKYKKTFDIVLTNQASFKQVLEIIDFK